VEWLRKHIMKWPAQLAAGRTEAEVLDALQWLAVSARLDFIELLKRDGRTDAVVRKWAGADYTDVDARDVTVTAFPFGARALGWQLKFGWRSEYSDVPPQMDIMLELAVDQLDEHLARVGSEYTKVPAPVEQPAAAQAPTPISPAHES
jgi:hypothetical protein